VDKGVGLLTDKSLSAAQRRTQVEALLGQVMDTRKLAMFCLGKAASSATPADLDAFADVFAKFTVARYSSQLGGYGGQTLKVTAVTDRSPADHVVTAILVDPVGPPDPDPVKVLFRVLGQDGHFGIVDASIEGVWFGLEQHDDIQGFLSSHGNDVKTLTARMIQMTADMKRPAMQ
jgi:ABC-type transporter MlaC component